MIQKISVLLLTLLSQSIYSEAKPMSVFTPPGDYSLQSNAQHVPIDEISSQETQDLIDQMFEVARGERGETEGRVMVGLAAPQIGCAKRIVLVDVGVASDRKELGELKAFINPEVVWSSDSLEEGREGCYSVDSRVVGQVSRPEKIKIKAFDRDGSLIEAEYSGFTARIFQHEIDHLNGIRFPDRVGPEGKLHWVEDDEYTEYKKNHNTWCRQCPWNLWLAMKEGKPFAPPKPYTLVEQGQKYFIGLELRTDNQKCALEMPAHKEKFFRENILGKISNKNSGDILALYTDYEGDYTLPYSWILGCEVSSLDEIPEGLVGRVIPASKYALFTTKGNFPDGLIEAWKAVWKSNLTRCYTSDFEVYSSNFDPEKKPEVKVYIAIEE